MLCKSTDKGDVPCTEQATVEVFWPGKETVACDRHHQGMQRIASAMGFVLSSRPIPKKECDCMVPALEGAGQHSPTCSIFK